MDKNNDILMDSVDERIEAFLRGTMSAEEEASFKQDIKENAELKHRAITMASLIKGFQEKESQKESGIINSLTQRPAVTAKQRNEILRPNKKRIQPILWWTCSVAAAFVVIFGIYKVHRHNQLDETVAPYYMDYDLSNVSRGDVDSVTITHLYTLFSQIQETRNMSDIIKELEPIYHSLDDDYTYHPWANDIAWNLALAYIKDDQIDKAITILDKLKQDNPDTPICTKSNELIQKIKDLK